MFQKYPGGPGAGPRFGHLPHDIDILIEDDRWQALDLDALAPRAIGAVLAAHGIARAELSVLACDDAQIATLNATFRDKATPTNVLSWPEHDLGAASDGAAPRAPAPDAHDPGGAIGLGDIAISFDTCAREAAAQDKPLADHVTHLIVHGALHLLGYDHIRDLDATRMESLEVTLLGRLGVPDPY